MSVAIYRVVGRILNVIHLVPVLPSYRNQSIDLLSKSIVTGFYMRATLALSGLIFF